MSFHVEFTAQSRADAEKILAEEKLPECVSAFISQALKGCHDRPVYVKALGHLFTEEPSSYNVSNCEIFVRNMVFREPKK
ncbi:MAG: hypothetical protein ACLQBD_26710 [Syntrophobacteraceae bacterium]